MGFGLFSKQTYRQISRQFMDLPKQNLSVLDFSFTKSTWIQFPKHGSHLPSGTATDFEWKDYCPLVFRNLQHLDNISYADYMASICGHETLREISSKGKSGFLLRTSDDHRFLVKTIKKSELKVLLAMLPNYYDHVLTYANTLLHKYYGIHEVRPAGGYKVHFVVVGNILQSDLYIHRRFDLKGSSQGRSLSKVLADEGEVFKDSDLELFFLLNPLTRHRILTQVKHDCEFLEAAGIMDYSLLLGLHIEASKKGSTSGKHLDNRFSLPPESSWGQGSAGSGLSDDRCYYEPEARLGKGIPARAIQRPRDDTGGAVTHELFGSRHNTETTLTHGYSLREPFNVQLFFGIIDILQEYSVKKRIEHMYKSLHYDSRSISAVNPKVYSTRFQEFLSNLFQSEDQVC